MCLMAQIHMQMHRSRQHQDITMNLSSLVRLPIQGRWGCGDAVRRAKHTAAGKFKSLTAHGIAARCCETTAA